MSSKHLSWLSQGSLASALMPWLVACVLLTDDITHLPINAIDGRLLVGLLAACTIFSVFGGAVAGVNGHNLGWVAFFLATVFGFVLMAFLQMLSSLCCG